MTPLRFGCLGAARIAPKALIEPVSRRDDVIVAMVAARDLDKAKAFASEHNIEHANADYQALVRSDLVDAVYCPLPPSAHLELVCLALENGKHVLCEKPFAMNALEAREMAEAARQNGRVLMEAFHYRYHPAFEFILEVVRAGKIGQLREIHGVFDAEIPYREGELRHVSELGGGALMDLGCYPLHMVRTLVGEEPAEIIATAKISSTGVDETVKARLSFPSDVEALVETTMAMGAERRSFIYCKGNDGEVHFSGCVGPQFGHEIRLQSGGKETVHTFDGPGTYDHQLTAFIEAVENDGPVLTGPDDAIANMDAIDRIYRLAGVK
ncbi:MAG: Gfo/Idh/MocA family oxidoreductase [Pseudomonadota bacterium]